MDTTAGKDEAAALEDEADLVKSKAYVTLYTTREKKSDSNYIVEQHVKAKYRQASRFMAQLVGYPASDVTWKPMKAFVHADRKLNELFVQVSFA